MVKEEPVVGLLKSSCMDKKILFLSGHLYFSKRKAGFHHLANAALALKTFNVTFLTAPNSILTIFKKDPNRKERNLSIKYAFLPYSKDNLTASSYFSLAHNVTTDIFQSIQNLLFKIGYSKVLSKKYDYVVFESGVSLFLFDRVKKYNPNAKFIYRVSDDLEMLNHKILLLDQEERLLDKFDLISSPSNYITNRLKGLNQNIRIKNHYHGIDKPLFDSCSKNPYNNDYINLIFVGTGYLDEEFLKIVKNINNNWIFHIIGSFTNQIESVNIIYHGEMPFIDTLDYIKYADVGMQIRNNVKGIEILEKSLKFIQYSYFKLPILAPKYMKLKDVNVFSYEHNRDNIVIEIEKCLKFEKSDYDNSWISSWDEVLGEII